MSHLRCSSRLMKLPLPRQPLSSKRRTVRTHTDRPYVGAKNSYERLVAKGSPLPYCGCYGRQGWAQCARRQLQESYRVVGWEGYAAASLTRVGCTSTMLGMLMVDEHHALTPARHSGYQRCNVQDATHNRQHTACTAYIHTARSTAHNVQQWHQRQDAACDSWPQDATMQRCNVPSDHPPCNSGRESAAPHR
jgi:hypothetical protein